MAVKNQLGANQISFSSSHPYQLCLRKLKHLNDICTLTTSESFMLEEIQTATRIFKFGATDLHFSLCFNQQLDDTGKLLNEMYHVESLRDEDCFSKSKTAYEIDAIFSMENTAKEYSKCLFLDSRFRETDLPSVVIQRLSTPLLDEIRNKNISNENK